MPPSIAPDEEEAERLTYATGRLTTAQLTMTKMEPVWRRQKSGDRCPAPGLFCGERLCAVIPEDAARQGQRCDKRTRAPWSACSSTSVPDATKSVVIVLVIHRLRYRVHMKYAEMNP